MSNNCDPWHSIGTTPVKGERMVMTAENFDRVCRMRDELIHEQRVEIAKLKMTVNKLRQRVTMLSKPSNAIHINLSD